MKKRCRHCRKSLISRPRGLCWSCYYTPGVREKFPTTSKYGRRGVGNFYGSPPRPFAPTGAHPGSAEKIAVLAERVRLQQELWHPDDASYAAPELLLQAG
jgi:hypothetical protein